MRPKKLNDRQERWLIENFSNKSNEELAVELNKKIREENEVQITRLKAELNLDSTVAMKLRIIAEIRSLQSFTPVTAEYVKHHAYALGCGKKSPVYISLCNRQKGRDAQWTRLLAKAEVISAPFTWFRSFVKEERKVGISPSLQHFQTLKSSLCNWNRTEGQRKGIFLAAEYNKQNLMCKVVAKSIC